MSPISPTDFVSANWRTLAEVVAAAVLLAVVQRSQATRRQSTSNVGHQRPTTPDLVYAASAVLQRGQTSTLEYGNTVRSRRSTVEPVPTVMRKFDPPQRKLENISEESEEDVSQSSDSRNPSPAPTSPSVSDSSDQYSPDDVAPSVPSTKVHAVTTSLQTSNAKSLRSQTPQHTTRPTKDDTTMARSASVPPEKVVYVPLTVDAGMTSFDSQGVPVIEDLSAYLKDHPGGFTGPVRIASRSASAPPRRESTPGLHPVGTAFSKQPSTSTSVPSPAKGKGKAPVSASQSKRNTRSSSTVAIDAESIAKTFTRRTSKTAAWFETDDGFKIDRPPDLTSRADLVLGDVYIHRTPTDYQLWVWEANEDTGPFWKEVPVMYARSDGKRLTVTQVWRRPSWVEEQWARKQSKKA